MKIFENKHVRNILKYLLFFIILTIIVIFCLNTYSKNKSYSITKAFNSFSEVENCLIDLNISRTAQSEEGEETINIIYKTLFDKNYGNDKLLAVDGSLGLEVESMKIGIYLPIKLIFDENLRFATQIDEVYQTIIEIPENNDKLHANLRPILSTFNSEFESFDAELLLSDISKVFESYLKSEKTNFNYLKNEEQYYILTGAIGRFNKNITNQDFELLEKFAKDICEENSLNYSIISQAIEKLKGEYTLQVYVNNNAIYRIVLFNKTMNATLNIRNVNYGTELSFPEDYDTYGLDLNDYLDRSNFNLLSLIGLNADGTANLQSTLQKHFQELISYMYLCLEYSENGDMTSAQNYIELMSGLISNIEETPNISENDRKDFDSYIDIYKLLMKYTIIYNQQCFAANESIASDLEEQLFNTVVELTDKLNNLGVDINETFGELIDTEESVPVTKGSEIGLEEETIEEVTEIIEEEDIEDDIEETNEPIIISPEDIIPEESSEQMEESNSSENETGITIIQPEHVN